MVKKLRITVFMSRLARLEAWSMILSRFTCQQVTVFQKQQITTVYGHIKENHKHKQKPGHSPGFHFYISSLCAGNNSPSTEITTVKITPKIDAFTKSNVPPCIETNT